MSGERLESTPVSVHIDDCFTADRSAPAYLLSRPAVQRRVRAALGLSSLKPNVSSFRAAGESS
jgi:hypothetical protein